MQNTPKTIEAQKCHICKEPLPLDFFTPDERRPNGKSSQCKKCIAEYSRLHYKKNKQTIKDKVKKYYSKNYEKIVEKLQRYPEKNKARTELRSKVKQGLVIKQPCEVCGEKKVQGHHSNYSKPLEVNWLCVKHHGEIHRKY